MTSYRFRPGWVTTLATLVLLPALVGLGFWQLDRADQKTAIRDRYRARTQMPPVDVNAGPLEADAVDFRRAVVRGRYREALTIYLDNKVLNGVAGYQIVTPLQILATGGGEGDNVDDGGAGRFILVNRGWVPWGKSRRTLPEIDTPGGTLALHGLLTVPNQDYFTLEGDDASRGGFRRRWQHLDLERYRRATGLALAPVVLVLAPSEAQRSRLVRRLPEYHDTWIMRHQAYAAQWFGLALTLLILYVALNLTKRKPDDSDHG